MAHFWARWLHNPCRLGEPHRFRAGGRIRSGPLVGKVATLSLPPRAAPSLQGGGQNQKWPTCGQGGYITPAASGSPMASERGAESEVAHLWAMWLHNACRLGGGPSLQSGGQNQKWPTCGQGGYIIPAASGSPIASQQGQDQKWPTCGQGGYITPAASGSPIALERGAESEVAHLWARWLHYPCRLGEPVRFRAGGRIRSGPLVGNVAT